MSDFYFSSPQNDYKKLENSCFEIFCGGDKSITHRAFMLSAMSAGESLVSNPSMAKDCAATAGILKKLGASFKYDAGRGLMTVKGIGKNNFCEPGGILDCRNSGTTARLLPGVFAGAPGKAFFLTGDSSLRARPMKRAVEPLVEMGAKALLRSDGFLPAAISWERPRAICFENIYNSAQIKTSVMLAALSASGVTSVIEKIPTRDHTENLFPLFGAAVDILDLGGGGREIKVKGGLNLSPANINVPCDPSSAAYYIMLAGLLSLPGDINVKIRALDVLKNKTRCGFYDCLALAGFKIKYIASKKACCEPAFDIEAAAPASIAPLIIDRKETIVSMIDEVPLLALALSLADGRSEIAGLSELRLKESDRLKAISVELNKMGAQIKIKHDSLIIHGVKKLRGAALDSHGDHRIAMTLIVAGLASRENFFVKGCGCVEISNISFFDELRRLGFKFDIK